MKQNKQQEPISWNSYQVRTWAFWFMIIMVVILSFYVIWKVNDGSIKCMANSWSYALNTISTTDNKPATCSCTCSFLPPGDTLFITKDNSTIVNFNKFLKP